MTTLEKMPWHEVYDRVTALEAEIHELRALLLTLKPNETPSPTSRNPVALGGLWAGANIPDEVIEAAQRSMFEYERKP